MTNQKSICICGSMAFIDEMESMAASLRIAGYAVATPISEESSSNWDSLSEDESFALKRNYIDAHLAKIKQSDLVSCRRNPSTFGRRSIPAHCVALSLWVH